MKKLCFLLIIIFSGISLFALYEKNSYKKVLKIESPNSLYIDINNNFVFDEKEPFIVKDIDFISIDKKDDDFLSSFSFEERIFLDYMANRTAENILKNKFIKIRNNEIYAGRKKYRDLLLDSGYFFDSSESSKIRLKNKIKEYNLDDYVLYNEKSKRYHRLNCKERIKSKNYKVVHKSFLDSSALPCRSCIEEKQIITEKNKTEDLIIKTVNRKLKKNNINVYFMDLNETFVPVNKCTTEACFALKKAIDDAESSIDFAIYGINNQNEIFDALVNAKKRGVKIRWVCDFDRKNNNYYKDTQKLKMLIPSYKTDEIYDLNNKPAIMHNKFFIFDDRTVFTGSANITSTDISGFNSNISLLINSNEAAEIYKREFEQMYEGSFHTQKKLITKKSVYLNKDTKIDILFSPKDRIITSAVIPLMYNAKKYVYIPIFFITKKEMINALAAAYHRGVDVRIINDATNAHTKYSIHKELRKYGIRVKTENYAGKLHTKAVIIDDEIAIVGSMNFSNNGEKYNDENVIVIYDSDIAGYLKETFLYLWGKIPSKYEKYDPRPESLESVGSCFDGIDNDFDGKTDKEDSGCFPK